MLKTLMLRKKINEAKANLEALRAQMSDIETRKAELQKREAELAEAIEEVSTEEETATVDEAVAAYETDTSAIEAEATETAGKISDLESEISEMERELAEVESAQTTVATEAASAEDRSAITTITERNSNKMLKTKSLRSMSFEERTSLVTREDVQSTLAQVRTLIKEKRAVTGAELTIGTTILGLVRENVMDYSKLYSRVNVQSANGTGRIIVQGVAPEAIWLECCDALPEVGIGFGQVELDCFKVGAYFAVCNARIEDSDIDLLDALTVALNQALGLAIDKAILYGTGVKMPTGIVTALADEETGVAANLVTIPANTTGKALIQQLAIASGNAKSDYSRGDITWVMNRKMYTKLVAEAVDVDASGAIVSGVSGVMPVVGGDIVVLNFVPDNNIVVGYYDLYALLERLGITLNVSEHAKFIEDQTVLRAKARMDGKPVIVDAFAAIGYGAAPTTSIAFAGQQQNEQQNEQQKNGEG